MAQKERELLGYPYICELAFSTMNINQARSKIKLAYKHLRSVEKIVTTILKPNVNKLVNAVFSTYK